MRNLTMESGSRLKITQKVDAKPNSNLKYDWLVFLQKNDFLVG